jgi:hypothetical protein
LQVLLRRDRAAEPRNIADVDEQGRARQLADDFVAERVFVADVDGDALPGDVERLLRVRAARKIKQRNVREFEKPAEHGL